MKVYRFAIHPEEDGFFYLECVTDSSLFTQARSLDEALYMARDVVETVYEIKKPLIEFVIPPDVVGAFEKRKKAPKRRVKAKSTRIAAAA